MRSEVRTDRYVTGVELWDGDTRVAFKDRTPNPGADLFGNPLVRRKKVSQDGSLYASATSYLDAELAASQVEAVTDIDTTAWELHGGRARVGDAIFVWDPPGITDVANEITFRGSTIWPQSIRLLEASWPLVRGMGVWYRHYDGAYTDLTDSVDWESDG